MFRAALVLVASIASLDGLAAEPPADAASAPRLPAAFEACARIGIDAERLACYDGLVAPQVRGAAEVRGAAASAPATAGQASADRPKPVASDDGSYVDEFWELTPERKRGTFNFTGYRPNYFFPVHVTSGLNRSPNTPAAAHAGTLPDYRHVEAKLQISVRTKLAEGLLLPNADLWFAYTQQSLWQIYSGGISRPFRATDHEPELIYIVPASFGLPFGFRTKMAGLGLAHQSNGQALPFSRSWNRLYGLGGIENGDVALTARYNWRIHESDGQDDNPDFTKYRGRTELLAIWSPGFYTLSALAKTNFDSRGSIQLDFTVPVQRKDPKGLRWYAQVFSGYGETLIDYNFRQTSFGAGVTLFGW
jgi:phospholipase A1